jgi:hypothetical protein
MDDGRAEDGFSRIQREIQAEKAAALARIAGTLEDLIAEMERTRRAAGGAADLETRARLCARHGELRERAVRYRWYLEVQREAVGITRHEALDEMYPIPGLLI